MTGEFVYLTPSELLQQSIYQEREYDSALTHAKGAVQVRIPKGPPISFVGHRVGLDEMGHTAVIGGSGAGKNLTMGPTFHSIVEAVMSDPTRRLLVIEVKEDAVKWLEGMGVPYELITFTYREGKAWELSRDFDSDQLISQLAYTLFPEMDGNNAFFRNSGRALNIAATSSVHAVTKGEWGIDDMVNLAFSDNATVKKVLEKSSLGKRVLNTFFEGDDIEESLYKVRTEVASRLWPLLVPAAKYQISEGLSLTDFFAGRTKTPILVVKINPEKHEIERPIAQALLQRAFDIIMSYPDVERKDKLVWIDDFDFYRGIPKFLETSELIRAKGGLLFILFQSIEGLRAKDSYGDKADAILANFMWKVMLRAASPQTAQWCASQFGRDIIRESELGTSYAKDGPSGREGERRSVENIVHDRWILDVPLPSPENGLTCYLRTPIWGSELAKNIPWEQVIKRHPKKGQVKFSPIPHNLETPALWSSERLHLMVTGTHKAQTKPSHTSTDSDMQAVEEEIRRCVYDLTQEAIEQMLENF